MKIWKLVYAEETTTGPTTEPPTEEPTEEPKETTFTQDQVNKILADDKRKHQKKNDELSTQLLSLRESANLTKTEKEELEARIEDIQTQHMSKEDIAKRESDKSSKAHKKELDGLVTDRDTWKNRYTQSSIKREITDAAISAEAFAPDQLVSILEPNTRLKDQLDEDGKPTGNLIPTVEYSDVDSEGKSVKLNLTVADTIKRMKESPKRFGNLFKSSANSGLGENTMSAGGSDDSSPPKDPGKYREWRKKHPNLV